MCTIRSSTCTVRYSTVLSDPLPVQSGILLYYQILYLYSPILYCTLRSSTCTVRYSMCTIKSSTCTVRYSMCTIRSSTCTVRYSTVLSDPLPVLPAGLPADGGLQDCGRRAAGGGLRQETWTTSSGQEKHVTAEQHVVSQSATGGDLRLRSLVVSSHQFGNPNKTTIRTDEH